MLSVRVSGAKRGGGEIEVGTEADLDTLLDRLDEEAAASKPTIVRVEASNGATLGIGLGRSQSVLSFEASLDPPYFLSAAEEQAGEEPFLVFFYDGHWTEFPRRAAIPIQLAREAVREFARTARRPTVLEWEEV
jgi:hypothetical protein